MPQTQTLLSVTPTTWEPSRVERGRAPQSWLFKTRVIQSDASSESSAMRRPFHRLQHVERRVDAFFECHRRRERL